MAFLRQLSDAQLRGQGFVQQNVERFIDAFKRECLVRARQGFTTCEYFQKVACVGDFHGLYEYLGDGSWRESFIAALGSRAQEEFGPSVSVLVKYVSTGRWLGWEVQISLQFPVPA